MTQIDLTDIYETFYPNTKEYTFFSARNGIFKTDHILGNKIQTSKDAKQILITPCTLSDHYGLK